MTGGPRSVAVEFGEERAFLANKGSRHHVAVGADDHGVPSGQPVLLASVEVLAARKVGGDISAADAGVHANDVDPRFLGDVAQGGDPHVGVVPGGSEVDVDPLGV